MNICHLQPLLFFFFNDTPTTDIYTLSLHDALPICRPRVRAVEGDRPRDVLGVQLAPAGEVEAVLARDRKSTRLNSSHSSISYAVFCLKKKNKQRPSWPRTRPSARAARPSGCRQGWL